MKRHKNGHMYKSKGRLPKRQNMDKTLTNGKIGIGKSAILKAAQPRRKRHGDIFMVDPMLRLNNG